MTVTSTQPKADEKTYGQILKSTALVGGSQVANIAIGIVRTKAMAMLLGPAGFGLAGLYGSIIDVTHSIAGMGINSSGVRQIAEAAGSGDKERMARTAAVLRRTSILLGVLGAVLLVAFSSQASVVTFGTSAYSGAVALLSVAVFFRLVSGAQTALIQGMRRIADLAKTNVLGALFGLLITIPVVYFYRERGVAPSLVVVTAMSLIVSWWYSRKIRISTPSMNVSRTRQEAAALLKLGFAFMSSALMMMGSAYAVRVIVLHKLGLEATGLYQSAWTLGGLYVGFILQAMGADFYPRLTAVANDKVACSRLVNEQTRVGLLLAGPGALATLTFAPIVISLFYSTRFGAAVDVLRWICLGVALRVITWPMGFIILAQARSGLFVGCDLAWTIVNLGLTWICISRWGLSGSGIAFFGSYVCHGLLIYPIVHRLSGFDWTVENKRLSLLFLFLTSGVFCGFHFLPFLAAACLGTLAAILSCVYVLRALFPMLPAERIPRRVHRFFAMRLLHVNACEPAHSTRKTAPAHSVEDAT
jgi:enterobacterial common antigen flippase